MAVGLVANAQHFSFSVGIFAPLPVYVQQYYGPAYYPQPVYIQPTYTPVYVEPVIVAPALTRYEVVPVYIQVPRYESREFIHGEWRVVRRHH